MLEQLWLFHCGWVRVPRSLIVAHAANDLPRLPFLCALAYHSDYGPILVDAPFGPEGPANVGALVATLLRGVGLKFEREWSVVPRVEQLGFRPSEVGHILMTHLHADHTGGMKQLGHAHFHITRSEWELASHIGPLDALRHGYQPDDFRAMRNRIERLDDPPPIGEDPAGLDVFGDGSIEAVGLPGHSVGHVGYRFNFADGRTVFHLGDAAFTTAMVTERDRFGPLSRSFAYDLGQARQTLQDLRLYYDDHPDELLVCSHDFAWGERCLDGPIPLHGQF